MVSKVTPINGSKPVTKEYVELLTKTINDKIDSSLGFQAAAVRIALEASEKATVKAEAAAEKRFEALNELRKMAMDWRSEFARTETVTAIQQTQLSRFEVFTKHLDTLEMQLQSINARGMGRSDVWLWIMAAFGALTSTFSLLAQLSYVVYTFMHH